MSQVGFNAKALSLPFNPKEADMGDPISLRAPVTVVVRSTDDQPLMEVLGFTDIKCFQSDRAVRLGKDIDAAEPGKP